MNFKQFKEIFNVVQGCINGDGSICTTDKKKKKVKRRRIITEVPFKEIQKKFNQIFCKVEAKKAFNKIYNQIENAGNLKEQKKEKLLKKTIEIYQQYSNFDIIMRVKKIVKIYNYKYSYKYKDTFIYFMPLNVFNRPDEHEKFGIKIHITVASERDLNLLKKHLLPVFTTKGYYGKIMEAASHKKIYQLLKSKTKNKNSKIKYNQKYTANRAKIVTLYGAYINLIFPERNDEDFICNYIQKDLQKRQNLMEKCGIKPGEIPITSVYRIGEHVGGKKYKHEKDVHGCLRKKGIIPSSKNKDHHPDRGISNFIWYRDDSYNRIYVYKRSLSKMRCAKSITLYFTKKNENYKLLVLNLKSFVELALKHYYYSPREQFIKHYKVFKKRNTSEKKEMPIFDPLRIDIFATYDPRKKRIFIVQFNSKFKDLNDNCYASIKNAVKKIKPILEEYKKILHLSNDIATTIILCNIAKQNNKKSQFTITKPSVTYTLNTKLIKDDFSKICLSMQKHMLNLNNINANKAIAKFIYLLATYNADCRKKLRRILDKITIKFNQEDKNILRNEECTKLCEVDDQYNITGYTTEKEIIKKLMQRNESVSKPPLVTKKITI
ncbi:MAG: hypothetical protein PVI75_00675 [Gammaproteobacteria bacterium]|jgi:hypothetical protein